MKVIHAIRPYPTVMARDVPQGQVYTWGTGAHFYMSTSAGSVCLSDGQQLGMGAPAQKGHFDQQVRIVECELHVPE